MLQLDHANQLSYDFNYKDPIITTIITVVISSVVTEAVEITKIVVIVTVL